MSSERGPPFIAVCYAHEVVGPVGGAKSVQYIRDKRERIPIAVIDSEAEKKDGWASGRLGRRGELIIEVLVQEPPRSQLFDFG
jgi:hypothetical protein